MGASGTPLVIKGYCQVSLKLCKCNEAFSQQLVIVESLMSKGILGLDFLEDQECKIDLS